jgi:hypothetical protein
MIERIALELDQGSVAMERSLQRYEFLERMRRCCRRRQVAVLAFGFGAQEIRLVLEGETDDIMNAVRGMKVGTTRAVCNWGVEFRFGLTLRWEVKPEDLMGSVVWAHQASRGGNQNGPLANPWSSHRDYLGFRSASFIDRAAIAGRVSPEVLHRALQGRSLPQLSEDDKPYRPGLVTLLRVAGAVLGVLPSDRRCFRLFSKMAGESGWSVHEIARSLNLTPRRIRQLWATEEPSVALGWLHVSDARLAVVP